MNKEIQTILSKATLTDIQRQCLLESISAVIVPMESELAALRLAHDDALKTFDTIASICFNSGADTGNGTALSAVKNLAEIATAKTAEAKESTHQLSLMRYRARIDARIPFIHAWVKENVTTKDENKEKFHYHIGVLCNFADALTQELLPPTTTPTPTQSK